MLKDIPEYNNLYKISSCGEVYNAEGKRIRGWVNTDGYPCVRLSKEGSRKSFLRHRLVLTTFVGACPDGCEARHLDGNPKNCELENLSWGTKKQNAQDKEGHGTALRGQKSPGAKLTENDVIELRSRVRAGEREESLSIEFKVHPKTITSVVNGRKWKHLPNAVRRKRKSGAVVEDR